MTHDEYSEMLSDAASEADGSDPQDLIEAMDRSLVEDVGVHEDYRILPDASRLFARSITIRSRASAVGATPRPELGRC